VTPRWSVRLAAVNFRLDIDRRAHDYRAMMTRATLLCAALLLAAAPLRARTIDVSPAPGALQSAIDAASDGDTLRIHGGTYNEVVNVTKRLRMMAARHEVPILDGGCAAQYPLNMGADRVVIRGLQVQGGTLYAIDVEQRTGVTVQDAVTKDTCGTAEYGINLYHSDAVKLTGNDTSGVDDAGIYIGGIDQGFKVTATKNTCHDSARGIIVEDSVASVRVRKNTTVNNTSAGIFLHNSDGILVSHNTVTGNPGNGIELDPTSDRNKIVGNTNTGNGADAVDGGTGNCWKGNSVNAPGGCP
jgi:parallel beta-helix repeat protein